MSSVVRKEKETDVTVDDIGCAMSMIQENFAGGKLRPDLAVRLSLSPQSVQLDAVKRPFTT